MKRVLLCFMAVIAVVAAGGAIGEDNAGNLAEHLVAMAGTSRGVCCVLGGADSDLPLALAEASGFLVHVLDPGEEAVAAGREAAGEEGFGIDRLVIEKGPFDLLPYADNLVDLILTVDLPLESLEGIAALDLMRVLRPRGKVIVGISRQGGADVSRAQLERWAEGAGLKSAVVKKDDFGLWVEAEKAPLEGVDNWSHWEHGPDNNPVSTDQVIKAPYMTQWLAKPYYIAMPALTTAAGGRIFTAMGHIAHHKREEFWLNTILARNGYNGAELWRRRLPDGYLVHRSAFVATEDAFIMIAPDGFGCVLLDPETGEELSRVRIPEARGDWKWIALHNNVLYALVGEEKDPPETTVVRSQYPAWSWGELSLGYYEKPHVPWGFGETIVACDLEREELLWAHQQEARIDSRAMVMGEGKLYFYAPDAHIGCLDAKSGQLLWTNDDEDTRELIEEPGSGLASTPGFRTTCFCVYTPKGLFYEAQTRMNIVGVSKDDGRLMWHRRKTTNNPNVIYLDGNILVGIGPEGNTLVVNPETGETIEDLKFRKRSCVRLTATPDSLFCRGWPEGITRYDRNKGTITFNGAMRPACNDGVIGANGLLYMGPWLCDCNLSLMGTAALCSAQDPAPSTSAAERVEMVCEDPEQVAPLEVDEEDWPAYRGGNAHTGGAEVAVSSPLHPLWKWEPERSFTPTAPTAAGGLIFLAGDDGMVRALDADTGKEKWSFQTAGPVMQPPTIWQGRAYVGSGDGYVYALEAATGRLLWRFHPGPRPRRILVYGSLCSTWPVNSGVVVEDGVAYLAAGIIDFDGTYVYALDAKTGAPIWENSSSGHLDEGLRKGVSAQGNLTIMDGSLWMAGGNVISPAQYDLNNGNYLGKPPVDGSPRANRGEEIGVFEDEFLVHGGRLRYSAVEDIVNPGSFAMKRTGRNDFALARGKSVPVWDAEALVFTPTREAPPECYAADSVADRLKRGGDEARFPAPLWRARTLTSSYTLALALAKDTVVAACKTPRQRHLTPRWRVCLLDRADGSLICEHDLPSAIRPNGLAIDRDGRVIVAMADGSLRCFGGRTVFQSYLVSLVGMAEDETERKEAIKRIQNVLAGVHDSEGRSFLIGALKKLGVDVFAEAKKAGCVSGWRLLGPIPWDAKQNTLDKKYVREPNVKLSKEVSVEGEKLSWQEYVTVHPTGLVDLAAIYGPHDSHAVYACAEVELHRDEDLLLMIGSNDGFKCWFNRDEVGRFDGGRVYAPDQDTLKVRAKKGINTILLKVSQMGGGWGFGVRITDIAGNPVDMKCATP